MRSNATGKTGSRNPARKPPSRVLNMAGGTLEPDVITDQDYVAAIAAQDAVLFAQGEERRILGKLRVRLERGATDAGVKYYFDAERGIVRRREKQRGA